MVQCGGKADSVRVIIHLSLGFPFCLSRFCFSQNLLNWQRPMLYTHASFLKGTKINIQCWANPNPAFRSVLICVQVSFLQRSKPEGTKARDFVVCFWLLFLFFWTGSFSCVMCVLSLSLYFLSESSLVSDKLKWVAKNCVLC